MYWRDIAAIVFAATAINHLGLIPTIERITKRKLWIIDCPKCLTFWSVMAYGLATGSCSPPFREGLGAGLSLLAISLLASYSAIWLELLMYLIDTLYNCIYDKINDHSEETRDEAGSED